ncbi:MAG: bifunctional orotidine-5'-phosphate decarboxylase/orotate phosphoribosyltransferase [Jaaginema sp. PMC 1079.18]|nr:bifunctional orotidine-5'-phosphate decarboxylase/orotate phosphoribosyltransferase [Jaaginema sp. PMC 1080.18]MEC4849789.1 bifunctional orotidine-5'-phosphate decarboxylase/orotate phosphoribosyltransferase [Jaaginema sp. PMC 1079.18]MEC4868205.1 bifunctional orotidine-5'-phosphate decarboxylase/orotate phosphoribosyltransferase [Jaaginema sp. PMC 1078.18]
MTKFDQAIAQNQSLLVVGLDPNPEMMPNARLDRPLLDNLEAWLLNIIEQTRDRVCAYKPTLGFYQALGTEGIILLEKVLGAIPENIPIILDAKHSDLNTSSAIAHLAFQVWQVDAITLNPFPGQDLVAPFLVNPDAAVFINCCTSNPAAVNLQAVTVGNSPYYNHLVREVQTWGTPEQVFLEVGTTQPEVLQNIRATAPERLILARSIWKEDVDLPALLQAGLDASGQGLLLPVPQDILSQSNPGDAIASLNQTINKLQRQTRQTDSCDVWMPNVCLLNANPHQDLILQLYDIGCILFGDYVQASGATFSYYIDLRKIISKPQVFHKVLTAYEEILTTLEFDRIAGIPYGSLPTATGLSLRLHQPMIFPRKEVKAHGTRRLIEGNFNPGEKVVVVDDILISGSSAMEGAAKLQSCDLVVEDIVVFLDHEGGVKQRLKDNGYQAYSVLSISEITQTLYEAGRITSEQYQVFCSHQASASKG